MNKLYIRLDVDNAGDSIELALLKADYRKAQNTHHKIQEGINLILDKINRLDSTALLMRGCDDILFSIEKDNYDFNYLEKIKSEFKSTTGFSLSIGVGSSIPECMYNLRVAKVSGKDTVIENSNS
ncbi:mCpol domain-containing protein [Pontibacter qinzhouensis]|uniref:mCpol domain-containing protein n=1 Tax=Pontibacter qinzhouensis TaxID=2603253 RepID=UPI00164FFC9E|nr:mCpol domain-containing protein [Pontibacter qinzhouensis]